MSCETPDGIGIKKIAREWMGQNASDIPWSVFEEPGSLGVSVRLYIPKDPRQKIFLSSDRAAIVKWLKTQLD